ncbi:MAG: ribosome maturation factor RimM [Thermodesulfobacteriota bacterium]
MAGDKVPEPAGLVHVGKVTKPHGIRGEVKIYSLSGQPENFRDYPQLILVDEGGERREYKVGKFRVQGNFAVVGLPGVADRNSAAELVGCQVWVGEDYLVPLDEDEFYWHDVMGAEVVDLDGNSLGRLVSLLATGGADLMVVRQNEEEVLIPSQPEFLVEIGPEKIIVDLPPGLLDINRRDT